MNTVQRNQRLQEWRIIDAHNLLDGDEYDAWRAAYDRPPYQPTD